MLRSVFSRASSSAQLIRMVALVFAGWIAVRFFGITDPSASGWYLYAVTALLAIGLYGSAYGISLDMVRRDIRTVLLAVTLGVVLKTALISAVMFAFFREPASLLLGLAVAQIDPLSVSAMIGQSRMSSRAKSILLAWASFDDPITALLTVYLSALLLNGEVGVDASGYIMNLWLNVLFVTVAFAGWVGVRQWLRGRLSADVLRVVAVVALIVLLVVAVTEFLVLGVALLGLFYRPSTPQQGIDRLLNRAVSLAFMLATFAVGMLLAGSGVDVLRAVVLGAAAFGAQVVVGGWVIARRLPPRDRVRLALGQQNGITAILLALVLVPLYPEAMSVNAVAVIAPAVLTVNILHLGFNYLWDRWEGRMPPSPNPPKDDPPILMGCESADFTVLSRVPPRVVRAHASRSRSLRSRKRK